MDNHSGEHDFDQRLVELGATTPARLQEAIERELSGSDASRFFLYVFIVDSSELSDEQIRIYLELSSELKHPDNAIGHLIYSHALTDDQFRNLLPLTESSESLRNSWEVTALERRINAGCRDENVLQGYYDFGVRFGLRELHGHLCEVPDLPGAFLEKLAWESPFDGARNSAYRRLCGED